MNSRLQWVISQFTRRLWFRAALYGVVALATALLATLTADVFPSDMQSLVRADAIEDILKILASSMLAVATFSLGTMVSAFSAAASIATPRATKLLIEDPISQNALATFIGAFIFSLIGIVALSAGFYGPGGRVVLFVVTITVIAIIIVTFFRWIDYLSNLGRLGEVLGKVERATSEALRLRRQSPCLGCSPVQDVPEDAVPLTCDEIGYVQHIDIAALDAIAESADGQVYVGRTPGSFADSLRPLAWLSWEPSDAQREDILTAFAVDSERSFDQDPRFGLIVLSEIASRALSPGINDPGTAIEVIGRIVKVLTIWTESVEEDDVRFPNVFVPEISVADLFDDAFTPIAREAAGLLEVGIRLQKAFKSLAMQPNEQFSENARRHAALAIMRSDAALTLDEEKRVLRELAGEVGARGADRRTGLPPR
ncbi:MAG: DUF2254 domain-containing protein [Alphaproteobacteria bacterium]